MKPLLAVLFLLILLAITAQAQVLTPLPRSIARDKTFSTSWDSIFVIGKPFQAVTIMVSSDSGTGTLYVATQSDTTEYYYKPVHQYEAVCFPPQYLNFIRIKATAAVRARVWFF